MKSILLILVLTIYTLVSIHTLNAQWIQQNSGTRGMLTDVAVLDSVTAIAVGRDRSILRTSDAGTTWINVAAPLSFVEPWNAISFFDTKNGIVVGDHGVVVTSSDGGKNWRLNSIPERQKCLSALHLSPAVIYVGADSGWVYHTSDTGNTWTSEKISTLPIRSLFKWRGTHIFGPPIYALTPYSLFTKNVFFSSPWSETILPQFQGLGSQAYDGEFCNGGGAGFIVGVQGDLRSAPTIIRQSMSDTAWRKVSSAILQDGEFFGVSAPSADVIYVCGSNGMIFKSADGGDNWIAHTTQTVQNINAISFYDERRGYAVGDSGLILYTSNGGITNVPDTDGNLPMKFALEQNYPNPFNPTTTISFSLPSKSYVSLKVFDVLGRKVATLISEELPAGTYTRQWNAESSNRRLSSGFYFYRLVAGAYSKTNKLILLR